MNNHLQEVDWGFTRERFPAGIHLCLIYDSDEDRQKITAQYMAAGLQRGELVRYVTAGTPPEEVRAWLLRLGLDLPSHPEKESLVIMDAKANYYPDGHFDPQAIAKGMPARNEKVQQAGYHGIRTTGEMSWALKGIPGSERLLEYEIFLNTVTAAIPVTGMCQYDARLFDGATLFKVLKVHPWMVVRGMVVQNPYYVSSENNTNEMGSRK